jgi:DNA-binding NarL/FixJ family response regulator
MTRHVFIAAGASAPARWRDAFPDAVHCTPDARRSVVPHADIVWLSAALPDWQAWLARLTAAPVAPAVVVLSQQPTQHEALLALDGGAQGYCHAYAAPMQLREIAVVVGHGGLWIGPDLMGRVISAFRRALPAEPGDAEGGVLTRLSPREQEVARAVAAGHSNKEIARLLGITERTVKAHLGTVFEKLGVRDRLQLALRVGA